MKKILICVCVFICVFSLTSLAQTEKTTLVNKGVSGEDLFRYEFSDGNGFTTNISSSDESEEFAVFKFDEQISWQFIRDGQEVEYIAGEMFVDNGNYVLIAYENNLFATFNFTIENQAFSQTQTSDASEDEILDALLQQLKQQDPETFSGVEDLSELTMTDADGQEIDTYVQSEDFLNQIYENLMIEMGVSDSESLADALMGNKIDNAKLTPHYDDELHMYVYSMPNGALIYTSIPNFGMTEYGVQLFYRDDATAEICNLETNEIVAYKSGEIVSKEGNYKIIVTQSSIIDGSILDVAFDETINSEDYVEKVTQSGMSDPNTYVAYYYFSIRRTATSKLESINAPEGFVISNITLDGETQQKQSNYSYMMLKDGKYEFTFSSKFINKLTYNFSIERDTRKPKLNISKDALSGKAFGKVEWSLQDESDLVTVEFNSTTTLDATKLNNEVSDLGDYTVTVTDTAGNSQVYHFSIQLKYNSNAFIVVILLLALVLAVVGYLAYSKRSVNVL